jgi:hypothetical protein
MRPFVQRSDQPLESGFSSLPMAAIQAPSSWLLKTAIQRAISLLPRSQWWNSLLQRYVTGRLQIQPYGEFHEKLKACRRHFEYYRTFSRRPREDFNAVEIGTGWFPIIPIGLFLCGAREIWTFDIVGLLRADAFCKIIEYFRLFVETGELKEILPAANPRAVSKLMAVAPLAVKLSPIEFLERLNIHALVQDVGTSGLGDASADLIFSHGVLELVEPAMLPKLLAELRRLASSDSVVSHYICIADQFATFDKSITPFNNLQFSARAWRWLKSPLVPQNRLRVTDYYRAMSEAGLQIVAEENLRGAERELARIRLAPEFELYDKQDLLVLFSSLVGRPIEVR